MSFVGLFKFQQRQSTEAAEGAGTRSPSVCPAGGSPFFLSPDAGKQGFYLQSGPGDAEVGDLVSSLISRGRKPRKMSPAKVVSNRWGRTYSRRPHWRSAS